MDKNNDGILNGLKYVLGIIKENATPQQQSEVDKIQKQINSIEGLSNKRKTRYADLPNGNHEADYTMIYAYLHMLERDAKARIPVKYWEFLNTHKLDVEIEIEHPLPEFVSANIAIVYREFIVSEKEHAILLRKHALKLFIEKISTIAYLIEQDFEINSSLNSFKRMLESANQITDGTEYISYTDQYINNMHPSIKQYVLKCITQVEMESKKFKALFL